MRARTTFLAIALGTLTIPATLPAQADGWWRHLSVLAHDSLRGRETGTREEKVAAEYVAAQFRLAGLEPGANGEWFQRVALVSRQVDEARSHVALAREDGATEVIALGRDASVTLRYTRTGRVDAPLVFVGHGLVVPELGYDDLAGLDLRGKVAVLITGGPPRIAAPLLAHHQMERWEPLRRAGAVGVITIAQPRAMDIPWDRAVTTRLFPAMSLADTATASAVAPVTIAFNPAKADVLLAGSGHTMAALLATADSGKALPRFPLRARLRADVAITSRPVESRNVVAILRGSDPRLSREYVAVSAHHDHLGVGPVIAGDSIYNGAMDDASGVATVIETALAIRESGVTPRRSLLFVVFTAEEKGLLGSRWFAQNPTVPRGSIVADVNVDFAPPIMPLRGVRAIGFEESDLAADVRRAAAASALPVLPDVEPLRSAFTRSDHYSFVREGVPAVSLSVGFEKDSPEHRTARRWREERYHAPSDDLAQPLDRQSAQRFNRFFVDVVREVADRRTRPRWNRDSFFRRFAAR